MLRIISLFLLLIISRISFAETIPATPVISYEYYYIQYNIGATDSPTPAGACQLYAGSDYTSATDTVCHFRKWSSYTASYYDQPLKILHGGSSTTTYTCESGYTLSDSAGNADSSGQYCTKNSCQDLYQTTSMIDIPPRQTVTNACFNGCSATSMLGTWVCDSDTACSVRVQFDGNSCSGGVDYAANASSSDSGSDPDSPPPCSTGSTTGTVNGETVTTCADDGTDSPPITDTPSSSTPTTTTSGAGSTVGSPENTSGTQNSTVGGGADSLGGEGYGEGGSAGSGGGTDSGSAGSSSGSDSGSTSGSSSGSDSGSTSGSGTGTDSGGTSGSGTGTDSGGTSGSGSGSGSDTGTGTATSGAGDTDPDTPAEEEEESGDGGGTFAAPGEGTDYLKDVFGESDLASLATDNAELTTKINQKMVDVKAIFNLGTLSVSGDIPENQQEIKGASVDLSGRNIFEQLSIVAAAFYLCAIATAIYIVMGGRK